MTVKELQELLDKYPPEMDVWLYDDNYFGDFRFKFEPHHIEVKDGKLVIAIEAGFDRLPR
jgi:hypothetical protein